MLLNRFRTVMSSIALEYGATIDKYTSDAILIFFGDPESHGAKEDAVACVNMAIARQRRMRAAGGMARAGAGAAVPDPDRRQHRRLHGRDATPSNSGRNLRHETVVHVTVHAHHHGDRHPSLLETPDLGRGQRGPAQMYHRLDGRVATPLPRPHRRGIVGR
jgi:hypothetical protein